MRTANATLHTAAGRHALRLAVVVALTELLVQRVALPRGYWAVVAAATVLRPEFAATFTRGAERVLGTSAGVVVATLIAVALDPSGWGVVAVVGALAFVTYAVFPASFTAGTAMLTGVIVFLLHAVSPDTVQTALDRGIDTVIGGAIGLPPTRSGRPGRRCPRDRCWLRWWTLNTRYLDAVMSGSDDRPASIRGAAPDSRPPGAVRVRGRSDRDRPGDAASHTGTGLGSTTGLPTRARPPRRWARCDASSTAYTFCGSTPLRCRTIVRSLSSRRCRPRSARHCRHWRPRSTLNTCGCRHCGRAFVNSRGRSRICSVRRCGRPWTSLWTRPILRRPRSACTCREQIPLTEP